MMLMCTAVLVTLLNASIFYMYVSSTSTQVCHLLISNFLILNVPPFK